MLYVHETHSVIGAKQEEFEAAYQEWMRRLAEGDDARLGWYFNQAHGSGPSYTVVTITAVASGAAWHRIADRVQRGDLREWASRVDTLRYDVQSKTLLAVHWSPTPPDPPTAVLHHPLSLYMEDTGWPDAPLDSYIDFWGDTYYPLLSRQPADRRLLEIQACFQVAHGSARRREAILLQKIHNYDRLLGLLATETPPEMKKPGTYMADALTYRDQWESRLLRTSAWSPLF